ncbi:MAG: DUF502 domain-containing protein [Alphaproteobacteria bacterium]|nr:DUF502 domain-containing protein [Alphaproteobacteria bacterium]
MKNYKKSIGARLRNWLIAGVLVIAPLATTFALAKWLIDAIDNTIIPLLPSSTIEGFSLSEFIDQVPGSGVVILLVVLIMVGGLTGGFLGNKIVGWTENLINHTPLRILYKTIKQILQTVLQGQSNAFKKPVMIEYPRKDCWAVGFVTNDKCFKKIADGTGDDTMVSIFLPTTPNPTSGFLLFIPNKHVRPLDMSVEEAIKLIISAGILSDENSDAITSESDKVSEK